MKKLVSAVMSITMIFSLTTCGFAAAEAPVSVSINADKSFTTPVTTSSEQVVAGLYSLITASKKTSLKLSDETELATLDFGGFKSKSNGVRYLIFKADDGSLYTIKSDRLYQLSADDFYRLVDESGYQFYKYRAIPKAKLGTSDMAITESSYKFKKLNGLFYSTRFEPDEVKRGDENGGMLQTPNFSVKPKSVQVSVTYGSGGQAVWSGDISKIKDFAAEKSGSHTVKYAATYESPHYSGVVVYEYKTSFSVRPKGIGFAAKGLNTVPGEAVFLTARNIPENGKVTVKTNINFTPSFFRQKNGDMAAILPINYYTASGSYYVELACDGVSQRFTIKVNSKKFTEQYLTVPPSTAEATINSQKANDEFERNIAPIRYVTDDKQYWSGRFIWPLRQPGRRTTPFGAIRYTNGDTKNPSRHGAIDFAAATGTPIYAPAAGRVLYSGNLQLTGNTICIEHGYGLKTWYYHMNGRNVKTGDIVKQNQQIGVVGSTGFSTGPHLHYGMSVSNSVSGNVFINPETSVTTDLFYAPFS